MRKHLVIALLVTLFISASLFAETSKTEVEKLGEMRKQIKELTDSYHQLHRSKKKSLPDKKREVGRYVTVSCTVDDNFTEASWNVWDVQKKVYLYEEDITFSYQGDSSYKSIYCLPGHYIVECYDMGGNGGIYGYTNGATTDVDWDDDDYPVTGFFHFYVSDLYFTSFNINNDLSVEEDDIKYFKFSDDPGGAIAEITNNGGAYDDDFWVRIYSDDDIEIGAACVSGIGENSTKVVSIGFTLFPSVYDLYEYHANDAADPARIQAYAKIDPRNSVDETEETNNQYGTSSWIYVIEPPTYSNYGWPVSSMDYSSQKISSTYGGELHSSVHDAIDIICPEGSDIYSVSSGKMAWTKDGEYNSYVTSQYSSDAEYFYYVHTDTPQHTGFYRNSGRHISNECAGNGHIHFEDHTNNGETINPLRSNGL
ncbi:MAG: hypothetical protein KAS49_06150, partial [Candidatus Cloacimonetes bacterium]|nr:hypothetical protein [Candidatus Cloacimonadota bacterium]